MKLPTDQSNDFRARQLYPQEDAGYFWGPSDYQPIVDSFGKVLVQVDDRDYQGDTRALLYSGTRYGFLNFGWGSCSGCDSLQACTSYADIEALIERLEGEIQWFDWLTDAKAYIGSPDRKVSYYYHEAEWDDFVAKVLALDVPQDGAALAKSGISQQ